MAIDTGLSLKITIYALSLFFSSIPKTGNGLPKIGILFYGVSLGKCKQHHACKYESSDKRARQNAPHVTVV